MTLSKKILLYVFSCILVLISIVLFCQAFYLLHLEKITQIAQFGFYKNDVTVLVTKGYIQRLCWMGGGLTLILGGTLFLATNSQKI